MKRCKVYSLKRSSPCLIKGCIWAKSTQRERKIRRGYNGNRVERDREEIDRKKLHWEEDREETNTMMWTRLIGRWKRERSRKGKANLNGELYAACSLLYKAIIRILLIITAFGLIHSLVHRIYIAPLSDTNSEALRMLLVRDKSARKHRTAFSARVPHINWIIDF